MSSIKALAIAKATGGSGGGGEITLETLNVDANATYNAPSGKAYKKVIADVPNSYAAGDEGKVVLGGALVGQTAHADVTPTTSDQTIDTTVNNSIKVKGDADLVAGNIKKDVEIFGVTGTYEGGGGGETEPALPSEYQRVEYLDFTPPVGIIVQLPVGTAICEVDFSSDAISASQESTALGNKGASNSPYDFEAYIGGGSNLAEFWFRAATGGTNVTSLQNYVAGTRIKLRALLNIVSSQTTATIGTYARTSGEEASALDGKFYSIKGYGASELPAFWFVPCYRKSDNQVGVYDHIAQVFYYETYAAGSGYSIVAGPDVT